ISDYEQMKVLVIFVGALIFLMGNDLSHNIMSLTLSSSRISDPKSLFSAILFGIAWFAAGIDFYSRLNFPMRERENLLNIRLVFTYISLIGIFIVLAIGIVFGEHLVAIFPKIQSPTGYTEAAMAYFLEQGSKIIVVVFFVSLFCMIFTTINTLL